MKIFVVYASAGAGHFKAAEAVYNYLKQRRKDADMHLLDVLEKANPVFRFNYSWGYSHLITYFPLIWQFAFWITYNKPLRFLTRPLASLINRLNTKAFAGMLIRENPDYVISTHFLPSEITAFLKKSKKITARLITIVTDFQVHPFWIEPETDFYVVASGFTKDLLVREGIKEDRIREFGIPIHPKFSQQYDKGMLRERLGIDRDKFTALIVTGSYGIGPIEEITDLLYRDIQILAVCARNKKLCEELKTKDYPGVKVFGFVDNIQELMAASDMIITKPGGLSISELLAMELVPVFISPIPGQETANIEALNNYGVGIFAKGASGIREIVLDYKEHPQKLSAMKERIRKIKRPCAAEELFNVICQDSNGTGG